MKMAWLLGILFGLPLLAARSVAATDWAYRSGQVPAQPVSWQRRRYGLPDAAPGTALATNFYFMHRCQIMPGGGVGHHFHNTDEEMFVIFDGEAEFTIDGRTSLLKGTVGAPTRMGHSHAIYNPSDKPVEFMNINISAVKGRYDAFNLDDARIGAPKDPIPIFMTMRWTRRSCVR